MSIVGYTYTLLEQTPTSHGELLSYQWEPTNPAYQSYHLHLSPRLGIDDKNFKKYHLPTGWVPIEAFLRMLIREFGVEPIRADWDVVLGAA